MQDINHKKSFEKEKEYRYGKLVFVVTREYIGSKRIGDLLSALIIRNQSCNIRER